MKTVLDSTVVVQFPQMSTRPAEVLARWEQLPAQVNLFRMMAHSTGSFVELMNLVSAVFKKLSLSDLDRELLVLLVGARTNTDYEWDQHVVIGQALGVSVEQITAIAERRTESPVFSEAQRCLLRLGEDVLRQGFAAPFIVNRAASYYSDEQVCDALLTVAFYQMISSFMKSLQIPSDAQADGAWVKR
ncbi:MAG: hypothetical protein GAK32_01822 [Pseudomonas fluorescens]|nr:MAG: hypothetical protein GAK32_01822 [Pseudomonas fluorescens]